MVMRLHFMCLLALILLACQAAPATEPTTNPTEPPPPSETPLPAPTATQTPVPTLIPSPTVSPEILKAEASPICENAFSAPAARGQLTIPFAVMKKTEYADAPSWEFAHQLPHMGTLSATDVRTVFCISETRTQAGTYTDGSAAYQLFWEVRAVSWPEGKVIARESFVGSSPPKTKAFGSGSAEGAFPDKKFGAWAFDQLDHPDFMQFSNAITTIAISPDGRIAAYGTAIANQIVDKDYQAKITIVNPSNIRRSAILDILDGHQGMVTSLAFSPDGKILASSGFDRFVKFWDAGTWRLLGQVSLGDTPNSLAFSADGSNLAVASNLEVVLIDPVTMQIEQSVQETGGDRLAFSLDDSHVYVHSSGSVKIIDTSAKRVMLTFPDPFTLVPTMSASADGSVVSVTYESPETVDGFVLSPDGTQIITHTMDRSLDSNPGTENVRLAVWDSRTGKYKSEIKFSGDQVQAINVSPNGNLLAIGNRDEIWVWETAGWQVVQKFSGHVGYITDLAFSPDEKSILSAGSDGTIKLWSLEVDSPNP